MRTLGGYFGNLFTRCRNNVAVQTRKTGKGTIEETQISSGDPLGSGTPALGASGEVIMACMNRIGYTCHGSENYGKQCKAKLRCDERDRMDKSIALARLRVEDDIRQERELGVGVRA